MSGLALITGASSGIGAATAEVLVETGWRVIATARRVDRLAALRDRLGEDLIPLRLDVTDERSVATLMDRLPGDARLIDALVNNAGHDVGGRTRFDQGTLADWEAIIATNLTGLVRVSHAIIPGMVARKRGHVVNIGSVVGRQGYAGGALYAASKFAVRGLTESLRKDFKGTGVRVTEIAPGLTRTEFAQARWRGDAVRAAAFYDGAKGTLEPEDIARAVAWALAQPDHVTIAEIVLEPSGDA